VGIGVSVVTVGTSEVPGGAPGVWESTQPASQRIMGAPQFGHVSHSLAESARRPTSSSRETLHPPQLLAWF